MDNSIFGKTQSDDFLFSGEEADNEFLENEAVDINDIAEKKSDRKEELIVNTDSKLDKDELLSAEDQLDKREDKSPDSDIFTENNNDIDFDENRRISDDIITEDVPSKQENVEDLSIENNDEKNNLDILPEQDVLEEDISDDNSLNENKSDPDNIPEKDESEAEQDIQEQESKLDDKLLEEESKLEENLPEEKNVLLEQNDNKTLDVEEKAEGVDTTKLSKESVKNKNLNKKVKEEIPNELFNENTENKLDFTSTKLDSNDDSSTTETESSDKDSEALDEVNDSKVESKDNIAEIELESENSNIHNLLAPSNEVKSQNDFEDDEQDDEDEDDYENSGKEKTNNNYCPEKLDFDINELESINDDFLSEIQAEKVKKDLAVKKKLGLDNIEDNKENDVNFEPLKVEPVLNDIIGLNASNIEEFLKSKRKDNSDDENKKSEIEEKDKNKIEESEDKIDDKIDVNDSLFNLKNFKLNEDLWEELNLSNEMKKKVETRVKMEIKSFLKNNFLSSLEKIIR